MSDADQQPKTAGAEEISLVEGGNYEIIRKRLVEHGRALAQKAERLNARRQEVFGSSRMEILGSERIRTENNCIPRDIVNVGGRLLFGYNVFIGLRQTTRVQDVFTLHDFIQREGGFEFQEVAPSAGAEFLADPIFLKNFNDLYQYNKETHLQQLRVRDGRLLAVFQIGRSVRDVRVFQWGVDKNRVRYVDDRGDRHHVFPPSHDFVWKDTTRDDFRYGEHPHVSINDRIFVECVGGDLTVKVENNTADGLGIYREPVEDRNQALNDAEIQYAILGSLILLKVKPYRESAARYLVYSALTHKVVRIDSIGVACVQLPEDHGIIFPSGYFLRDGETKVFEHKVEGLEYKRMIRSPNGEDVLYVFHRRDEGLYVLLTYNLIRKEVQNPILCHGNSLFEDGKMVIFKAQEEETRVHQMQIWQTPFTSDEYAARQPNDGSFLSKIGNADLVRGISDGLSLQRAISAQKPTVQIYEDLIASAGRVIDAYHWLGHAEVGDLLSTVKEIRATADLIVDEFEKVLLMRKQAQEALELAVETQRKLFSGLRPEHWKAIESFVKAIGELRTQRGHLITLRELRYIDLERINALEAEIVEANNGLSRDAVRFLLKEGSLKPYHDEIDALTRKIDAVNTVVEAEPLRKRLEEMSLGLDLLTEVVGGLKIDDATARTRILEGISEVFALLNRTRALLEARRKELLGSESVAEFAAQFKLFGQSVTSALGLSDAPEKCDDQLSRLLVQLEDLESRFSEFDAFLLDLATKRDEVYEAFESRKQSLTEERQRRASNMTSAADRIIQGVLRRALAFKDDEGLNAYFASDAMVLKVRDLADQLRALGDSVKADDVEARIKAARDQALRSLRDKKDIYEDGANVIRLGRHRFSVNTQELELTMLPREDHMALHLTGTEFYERIDDPALNASRRFWPQHLVSEINAVYRAEYLAYCILDDAERKQSGLSLDLLRDATRAAGGLLKIVRDFSAARYDEGYDRGIHDADAADILEKLLHLRDTGGLLRFAATPRALACLFWAHGVDKKDADLLQRRARSLGRLRASFGHVDAMIAFGQELAALIERFIADNDLADGVHLADGVNRADGVSNGGDRADGVGADGVVDPARRRLGVDRADGVDRANGVHRADGVTLTSKQAGAYLAEELTQEHPRFVTSREASQLIDALMTHLDGAGVRSSFDADIKALSGSLRAQRDLVRAWLQGLIGGVGALAPLAHAIDEAVAIPMTERRIDRNVTAAMITAEVTGLLGQHPRINARALSLRLDEFLDRLDRYRRVHVPGYQAWRQLRQATLERERERLRLSEYLPRVLTSFVRNKLITDVYLPIIGDNLAKQMGALGDQKRTDLMGMLLLISPPGYGKTTLMEYIANRLGLIFMKINGPALGHGVTSLDPSEAPNATARQELLKVNLALEMGNNVMLYVDDIQHTHPEFLQKFISLCDAQRKIEGVWKGRTRTYDLRGKKFCVVMAGNPYTESGDKFQIPDMLANRADTYNLGDILDGREEVFSLSYIENSLTSNAALQPLATRDPEDTYKLIRLARGEDIPIQELKHNYAAVEVNEIVDVFKKLFVAQEVLLKVNQTYISSASQDDAYRTEPPFKLQGSYRNMNKITEKVASAMNAQELQSLIDDHYTGESQTLTVGAEQNLLKLAELRGRMSDEQRARWADIKKEFVRRRMMGGANDDPVMRVTGQLSSIVQEIEGLRGALDRSSLGDDLKGIREALKLGEVGAHLDGIRKSLQSADAAKAIAQHLDKIQQSLQDATLGQEIGRLRAELTEQSVKPQLVGIQESIKLAAHTAAAQTGAQAQMAAIAEHLQRLSASVDTLAGANMNIEIVNQPSKGLEEMLAQQVDVVEWTLVPLVRTMAQDLQGGREIWERLNEVLARMKSVDPSQLGQPTVFSEQQPTFSPARPQPATPGEPPRRRPIPRAEVPPPVAAKPDAPDDPEADHPQQARGPSSGVIRPAKVEKKPRPPRDGSPVTRPGLPHTEDEPPQPATQKLQAVQSAPPVGEPPTGASPRPVLPDDDSEGWS